MTDKGLLNIAGVRHEEDTEIEADKLALDLQKAPQEEVDQFIERREALVEEAMTELKQASSKS